MRNQKQKALNETVVMGLITNKQFLLQVLKHQNFQNGKFDTHFIEKYFPAQLLSQIGKSDESSPFSQDLKEASLAAFLFSWKTREENRNVAKHLPSGWRNNFHQYQKQMLSINNGGSQILIEYRYISDRAVPHGESKFDVRFPEVKKKVTPPSSPRSTSPPSSRSGNRSPQPKVATPPPVEPKSHTVVLHSITGNFVEFSFENVRRKFDVVPHQHAAKDDSVLSVHSDLSGDFTFAVVSRFASALASESKAENVYVSPMPCKIFKLPVTEGQSVSKGEILVVLESMKMETKVYALTDGIVSKLNVKEGQIVPSQHFLLEIASQSSTTVTKSEAKL